MGLKSSWALNNGKKMLKDSIKTAKEIKERKKAEFEKKLPDIKKERESSEDKRLASFEKLWQSLKAGDVLKSIGVIKKKNLKSIINSNGVRWTKREVYIEMY